MTSTVLETSLDNFPVRRGKVRDIYDLGDRLLLVSTDRISAFDWVLPTGIPDKGRVLTQLSRFWLDRFDVPHHLLSCDVADFDLPPGIDRDPLVGRSMLVRKSEVVPIECVVRGYLSGSGWKEYQASGTVCGIQLPAGLRESDQLPEPIFTPATKAEIGEHDENITFEETARRVGRDLAEELRRRSLDIYNRGAQYARTRGIIIADTKFEFGLLSPSPVFRGGVRGGASSVDLDELILIDEVLTPDSSRFWPADQYSPGQGQPSFDKQFVRDWLTKSGWDKNSQPPELPAEVVARTRAKYIEAFERLTAETFPWK
ncbi:MAG TPA: phosphoribosylaminoimidazolesuccinocarboxamide synthase [Lacipirellulaceae bacterium]